GVFLAEAVGARVELDAAGLIHEMREARLAVMADRHDAPGETHRPEALQLLVAGVAQALGEIARPLAHRIAAAERVDPAPAQIVELRPPQPDQLVVVRARRRVGPFAACGIVAHASRPRAQSRNALMNGSRSQSMTPSTLPTSSPVRWSLISW